MDLIKPINHFESGFNLKRFLVWLALVFIIAYGLFSARSIIFGPSIEIIDPPFSEFETKENTITIKGKVENVSHLSLNEKQITVDTEQGEVVSFKYANRGTAAYQMELLASSVFQHALKSEREEALAPHAEFDEALEEISGASFAAYAKFIGDPDLVAYFQAASPLEEISLLNIGSRPARRFGAKSLADLRAIPWVFAWAQNRHSITGWYGVGSGLKNFIDVRGDRGFELLRRMFEDSRMFRLIIDEVEKTLALVDLSIAKQYAGLVADEAVRTKIFKAIEDEFALTREMALRVSGGVEPADRFKEYQARLSHRLQTINEVNREQVALLRRFREAQDEAEKEAVKVPLLLSISCVAAGLGATG